MYISFVYNQNTCSYEEFQINATQQQVEILQSRAKSKGEGFSVITMHTDIIRQLFLRAKGDISELECNSSNLKNNVQKVKDKSEYLKVEDSLDWRDVYR